MLSACATPQTTGDKTGDAAGARVAPPGLGLFSNIRAPGDVEPVLRLAANGVQIFRCERAEGAITWVFRQPDAELVNANGQAVGRHGANFSFEHNDGSRLLAQIVANDAAPDANDLRWLLLTTRSFGKGAFDGITHVQRVDTRGGMPPAGCQAADLGKLLRVDFAASFVFYRPRSRPD